MRMNFTVPASSVSFSKSPSRSYIVGIVALLQSPVYKLTLQCLSSYTKYICGLALVVAVSGKVLLYNCLLCFVERYANRDCYSFAGGTLADVRRKVCKGDFICTAENDGTFYAVAQFSNVSRPVVFVHGGFCSVVESYDFLVVLFVVFVQETCNEQPNVFLAFTER